ncbi:MAG TPA: BamA/TamA family outer membrane protein [Gemmatimonadales bacterium]
MRRRAAALLLPLLAGAIPGCYTQADVDRSAVTPMFFRVLPYPTYDTDEHLMGHLVAGWRSAANRRAPPVSKAFGVDARIATSGTRGVLFSFDAPGRWRNWRILAVAGSERLQRAPFYGIGNSNSIGDSLPSTFYRYSLLRTTGLATVERHLVGPIRLHAAIQWRHYHARPEGDSTATLFGQFVKAGFADTAGRSNTELRGGLLFDTRDEEASPTRGVFLEAMAAHSASGYSYTRTLWSAREFLHFGSLEQWVIGLRQGAELATGSVPVFVSYERLTTWYPDDGFGGPTSLRLFAPGRFLADNRAIVSADLRYKYLDAPFPSSPVRIWILGFADAGRLWNHGEKPDLHDWHWTTGAGMRLQLSKSTIIGLDLGVADGAPGFGVGTSFAF